MIQYNPFTHTRTQERERTVVLYSTYREFLLGFNALLQAVCEASTVKHTATECVDNGYCAVLHYVLLVGLEPVCY
jgi:hypothetical protein